MSKEITLTSPTGLNIQVPTGIFIDNEFKDGEGGNLLESFNPTTGEVLAKVAQGSAADVDRAVASALKAYNTTWGQHILPSARGKLLLKLADLIEEHADALGQLEALDNGKPRWMATDMDVADTAGCFRYYGGLADKIEGKTIEIDDGKRMCFTRQEPIGVCGAIIPWNYPLMMLAWKLGPALAAGNTIILKPAEQTPLTALYIAKLTVEAGFPPGVISVVNGLGSEVGAAIASHQQIDKVAFTGSTVTGRKIMEAAARSNLKKVSLELGGKSPVLVFDDVDLNKAIPWLALAMLFNMGQDCTAGSRMLIQSSVVDKVLPLLIEAFEKTPIGEPFDDGVFLGPQVSRLQKDKIDRYIALGKEEGATVAYGGDLSKTTMASSKGYYVPPTIFTNCKKGMKVFDEEIFGPVLSIATFDTEEEAIQMANDSTYGLGAGIFSESGARCWRCIRSIVSGTVWVNNYAVLSNAVPFGGTKQSGFGRELGKDALKEWTQIKAVHWNVGDDLEWPITGNS